METPDLVPLRTVVASCSDRSGLRPLLDQLARVNPGLEVYASSGTLGEISSGPLPPFALHDISVISGVEAMPGGLVKTLSPALFAGILAEPGEAEQEEYLQQIGGREVDLVIANLYPFREQAARTELPAERVRTSIDIGGSALIRAAAKNFRRVSVLVDPQQYDAFAAHVTENGGVRLDARIGLAGRAFALSADYDAHISRWFEQSLSVGDYNTSRSAPRSEGSS